MMKPQVLLLAFNELYQEFVQRWMESSALPNFKLTYAGSQIFATVADAPPPELEPWVQRYSVHTGLRYAQHGVFRLTDGTPLMQVDKDTDNEMLCGCQLRKPVASDAMFVALDASRTFSFFEHFYQIEELTSGCHHPDGALWVSTGSNRVHADRVSVLDIFPTVLDLLDVRYAPSNKHPFTGRSLLPLWDAGSRSRQRAA